MTAFHRLATAAALAVASAGAWALPFVVDVSGAQSVNLLGESGNTVLMVDVGADAALESLQWDVTLEALAPSVLSEMQVSFGDASGASGLTLTPGSQDFISGVARYTGLLDLRPFALKAGADGWLRVEFSESFKDLAPGVAEGRWLTGTLRFETATAAAVVPEPASAWLAVLGLGVVAGAARARRARNNDR